MINLENWGVALPDGKLHYPGFYTIDLYQQKYGLVMRTRCDAQTTKNSNYPRCELREMTNGKKACWDSSLGTHKFTGVFTVSRFTYIKPEVCVFQIHDGSDDVLQIIVSPDWVKYRYNNVKVVLGAYHADEKFRIKCKVLGDHVYLKYNFSHYICLPLKSKTLYFKAGNYLQSNAEIEESPDEYSQVLLHKANVKHFI